MFITQRFGGLINQKLNKLFEVLNNQFEHCLNTIPWKVQDFSVTTYE
ncbi:hypothetical protein [Paenibacillus pini]